MVAAVDASGARRGYLVAGVVFAALIALVYVVWAAFLALGAGEGSIPPESRVPEVPTGARIASESKQCGSGGCWRELSLQPAAGQSADDLAAQMGLTHEIRHWWRPLDPHTVRVGSQAEGERLSVYVQY